MKIMLIANFSKKFAMECTTSVCEYLHSLGVEILMKDGVQNLFFREYIVYANFRELVPACECCIVIGGDGTIIHSAKKAMKYQKPVLGINAGRLGFLAGLEQDELTKLDQLVAGDYQIEKRMILEATHYHNQTHTSFLALNDVVISKGAIARMIDINVKIADHDVTSYRADGVIFSTPTGSTAYAMSAGGPILDPNLHSIAMTPISPHSLFDRTIVFSADTQLDVSLGNERESEVYLTVDGEQTVRVYQKDQIVLQKSKEYAQFIHLCGKPFYEVLNEKFLMRAQN